DPVRGKGDRVDRTADQVDARACRLQGKRKGVAPSALAVEADGEPGQLAELGDQFAGAVRLEEPGGVVEDDSGRPDLRHPASFLDQRVVAARPVQKPGVELAS